MTFWLRVEVQHMRLDMVLELLVSWYWYCWCPLLAPASRTGCGAMARLRGCHGHEAALTARYSG